MRAIPLIALVLALATPTIASADSPPAFVLMWGSPGMGSGQFNEPNSVAVGPSGAVYVAEIFGHRVQKFDADGAYITSWGSEGSADGQFSHPSGLCVDAYENVYVADNGNFRIQ